MKRFWDTAETVADGEGWRIQLDGKPVRIPGGATLTVPSRKLADAIAAEWQVAGGEKGGEFNLQAMALTRLAGTAQERVAPARETIALELARFGETDLLCYRAERPPRLVERQHAEWQPWLDWADRTHGARLAVTAGIIHVPQDSKALAALAAAVAAHDTFGLAALGVLVPALGSLVLGLAVAGGALSGAEAHAISALDDIFQEELWGRDADAHAGRLRVAAEMVLAENFLILARA